MIPNIIALALGTSFLTLVIRMMISRRPFQIKSNWAQIILSIVIGLILWVIAIVLTAYKSVSPETVWGDIICGVLIFFCTFWCHYWSGNLAGGFRIQMLLTIAYRNTPISLEEWMNTFGGLGMDAFLKDRIEAILIPSNAVVLENDQLRLLPGWGMFFGRLTAVLKVLMPNVRSDE